MKDKMKEKKGIIRKILTVVFVLESIVWLALPIMAFSNGNYSYQDLLAEETVSEPVIVQIPETNPDCFEYDILADGTAEITAYHGTDTKVVIPAKLDGYTVSSIGECAFYAEKKIKNLVVSEGVEIIGISAFQHMKSLQSVVLPRSIKVIDNLSFAENKALTDIVIPEGVIEIGEFAFGGCKALKTINIPATVSTIYLAPFDGCKALTEINVAEDNEYFTSENGILFSKDKAELICYPAGKTETEYEIPGEVEIIKSLAFSSVKALEKVEISGAVNDIEILAFYDCVALTIHGYKGTESEYYADENSIEFVVMTSTIPGDVDDNGVVDYNDYALVVSYIRCEFSMSGEAKEVIEQYRARADVNCDGSIDAMDAIEIDLKINSS